MANRKIKKGRISKTLRKKLLSVLFSSAAVVAFITGVFSLFISHFNTLGQMRLENQKYFHENQKSRYEELQEAQAFFSEFQVYSSEFINIFSAEDDDAFEQVTAIFDDSVDAFGQELQRLSPFLSAKAIGMLSTYIQEHERLTAYFAVESEPCEDNQGNTMPEHLRFMDELYIAVKENMQFSNDLDSATKENMQFANDLDKVMKEHMRFVNAQYDELSSSIVNVINYDIYSDYNNE